MSQAGIINTSTGPVPPSVATQYNTDVNSPSIPALNIENVLGGSSTTNNLKGVQTDGSSGGNTITIQLTNRFYDTTTTSDGAGQTQIFSVFPLGATPGTYIFDSKILAFNVTDSLSATYEVSVTRRTTGAAVVGLGPDTFTAKEEGAMIGVVVTVTDVGNNLEISVTGLAGKVIHWLAMTTYLFVS